MATLSINLRLFDYVCIYKMMANRQADLCSFMHFDCWVGIDDWLVCAQITMHFGGDGGEPNAFGCRSYFSTSILIPFEDMQCWFGKLTDYTWCTFNEAIFQYSILFSVAAIAIWFQFIINAQMDVGILNEITHAFNWRHPADEQLLRSNASASSMCQRANWRISISDMVGKRSFDKH